MLHYKEFDSSIILLQLSVALEGDIDSISLFIQTWPTEAEIAEADANSNRHKLKKKKLPRGTSDYQVYFPCFTM